MNRRTYITMSNYIVVYKISSIQGCVGRTFTFHDKFSDISFIIYLFKMDDALFENVYVNVLYLNIPNI